MGVMLERWERGWQRIDHVQTPWALTGVSIDIKRDAAGEIHPPNSPGGWAEPRLLPKCLKLSPDQPSELTNTASPGWSFPGGEGLARLGGRAAEDWGSGGRGPSLQSWWAGQEVQPRIVPARRKDALSCGFSSFLGLWNPCRLSPLHPPRGEPFSRGWQRFLFLACLPGCYDQKAMGEAEKTQNVKIICV